MARPKGSKNKPREIITTLDTHISPGVTVLGVPRKNNAGRPPKVTADSNHVDLAWEYVNGGFLAEDEVIPTIEGLAVYLYLHKDTIYARTEFSDVIQRLKMVQGKMLVSGGLNNRFNNTISKLILASKHDYVEKTEQKITATVDDVSSLD